MGRRCTPWLVSRWLGQEQTLQIMLHLGMAQNMKVCKSYKDIWALGLRVSENLRGCLNPWNEINNLHETGVKWRVCGGVVGKHFFFLRFLK